MATVFLGIGSNLGDRRQNIEKAIECLKNTKGVVVSKVSRLKETKPQNAPGPDYLNGVAKIEALDSPRDLLIKLQECEKELGRRRTFRNAPRIIDLDILLYDEKIIDEPGLIVPHPRMFERDFVIEPLLEIEPELKESLKSLKLKVIKR